MLNVHHLTYHNDNKPWQYDKEELLLLCKDCHAKRHGKNIGKNIIVENQSDIQEISEQYTNQWSRLIVFILTFTIGMIVIWFLATYC